MSRKTGLGKGLGALIPGSEAPVYSEGQITPVDVGQIQPNPRQPRRDFDEEELRELAASIKEHGILQPLLLVNDDSAPGKYLLIAGERRWQAAQRAGLASVPAIIRTATEQQMLELALIENVQRADLSALETAEAYRQLADDFGLPHEEIAQRVGKSRAAVTNTLRLLKLPVAVQAALRQAQISEGHARALLGLPTPQSQTAALQTVIKNNLNVRQTEELVRKLMGQKPIKRNKPLPLPEVQALEERLARRLSTRVTVNHRGRSGSITIYYYSEEELDALIELIDKE